MNQSKVRGIIFILKKSKIMHQEYTYPGENAWPLLVSEQTHPCSLLADPIMAPACCGVEEF